MVTIYGLSEKVGNLTYYDSSGQSEMGFTKPYSEQTAELIDREISEIIETQYQRAIALLTEHKDKLTELAEVLLEKEVIFKDNLEKIFGKRAYEKEEILDTPEKESIEFANENAHTIQPTEENTSSKEEVKGDLPK